MTSFTEMIFILVVIVDLFLLASSRLNAAIRAVAFQGAVLSLLPVIIATAEHQVGHTLILALSALMVKALFIPWLMFRAIRDAAIRREVEPIIGFVPSMMLGGLGVVLAFAFSSRLPIPISGQNSFIVPTALSTVWTGLLLVIARKKAVTQVLGFLVLENGVFVFGMLLTGIMPTMVEAGMLLDLLAAVFVMGIVLFHINREFSSLDTAKLSALKD